MRALYRFLPARVTPRYLLVTPLATPCLYLPAEASLGEREEEEEEEAPSIATESGELARRGIVGDGNTPVVFEPCLF